MQTMKKREALSLVGRGKEERDAGAGCERREGVAAGEAFASLGWWGTPALALGRYEGDAVALLGVLGI